MSQLRDNCRVTMTDLPLASEISAKNLEGIKQHVTFQVLDWDAAIPADILAQRLDMIVVADCMYNADAAPALVSVIARLASGRPEATLVIAHKKRHDSEEEFLHLLTAAGMAMVGRTRVDIGEEYTDLEPEGVDLYAMRFVGA